MEKELNWFQRVLAQFFYYSPKMAAFITCCFAVGTFACILLSPSEIAFFGMIFCAVVALCMTEAKTSWQKRLPEYRYKKIIEKAEKKIIEIYDPSLPISYQLCLNLREKIETSEIGITHNLELWLATYENLVACKKKLKKMEEDKPKLKIAIAEAEKVLQIQENGE
ncbi:hypothetical protein ACFLZC_00795 [Patescibacteria group bacterium]